jgi:hypothetical protein
VRIVVRWRPFDRVQRRGLGEFVGTERIGGEQRIGIGLRRQCPVERRVQRPIDYLERGGQLQRALQLERRCCIERRFRRDQLRVEQQLRIDGGLELEWCLRFEQRELPVERRLRFEQQLGCGG